jgi:hypothetical protein
MANSPTAAGRISAIGQRLQQVEKLRTGEALVDRCEPLIEPLLELGEPLFDQLEAAVHPGFEADKSRRTGRSSCWMSIAGRGYSSRTKVTSMLT